MSYNENIIVGSFKILLLFSIQKDRFIIVTACDKKNDWPFSMAQYYSTLFFFTPCPIVLFPVDCHHSKPMVPFQFDFWIL